MIYGKRASIVYDPTNGMELYPASYSTRIITRDHQEIGCAHGYAVRDDHSPWLCDWRWLDGVLEDMDRHEEQTGAP